MQRKSAFLFQLSIPAGHFASAESPSDDTRKVDSLRRSTSEIVSLTGTIISKVYFAQPSNMQLQYMRLRKRDIYIAFLYFM